MTNSQPGPRVVGGQETDSVQHSNDIMQGISAARCKSLILRFTVIFSIMNLSARHRHGACAWSAHAPHAKAQPQQRSSVIHSPNSVTSCSLPRPYLRACNRLRVILYPHAVRRPYAYFNAFEAVYDHCIWGAHGFHSLFYPLHHRTPPVSR